jgi:SpoVK/Ycf46/Vps4 family AAA+-type ATPase
MLCAVKRQIELVTRADAQGDPRRFLASLPDDHELLRVRVSMTDFAIAARSMRPSLSAQELQHYDQLQKQFARARKAN